MSRTRKRLLSLVLALMLMVGMVPAQVWATEAPAEEPEEAPVQEMYAEEIPEPTTSQEESSDYPMSGTCGENLTWTLDADGLLTIRGNGAMADQPWGIYSEVHYLTKKIVIENGVTTIGNNAFANFDSVKRITVAGTVRRIGTGAFEDCVKLKYVQLQGDALEIESPAFTDEHRILMIYPKGNDTWTEEAMQQYGGSLAWGFCDPARIIRDGGPMGNLYWILDEDGGLSIFGTGGANDFPHNSTPPWWEEHYKFLRTVTLGSGVVGIGYCAFNNAINLTSITIEEDPTAGIVTDDTQRRIAQEAFTGCESLTSIPFIDGVTYIGHAAYACCYSVSKIIIPSTVTELDTFAIDMDEPDNALKQISFLGDAPKIGEYAFFDVTAVATYPAGNPTWTKEVMQDYEGNITWVPRSIVSFGNCGAQGDNLTWELEADGALIITGTGAMADQPWETNSEVLSSTSRILVGDGVTTVGSGAFSDFTGLKFVQFKGNAPEISSTAFSSSKQVLALYPKGDETWTAEMRQSYGGNLVWIPCDASRTVTNCGLMGRLAWILDDTGKMTLTGTGGYSDFPFGTMPWASDMNSINTLSLGSQVTGIGDNAFQGAENLETVTVEEDTSAQTARTAILRRIGKEAFQGCSGLSTVAFPAGIESIGQGAFDSCASLMKVTIPSTVTTIESSAFADCESLRRVSFEGDAPAMDEHVFLGVTAQVTYPAGNETWNGEVLAESGGNMTMTGVQPGQVDHPFVDVEVNAYYETPIVWAVHEDITGGTGGSSFSPMANCTRAQVVTFLWRAEGCPVPSSTSSQFTDVEPGQFYYDAVLWATEKGITSGISKTQFGTMNAVTRGEFVTFLWRANGQPAHSGANPFTDVEQGQFYYDAVLWAAEKGITSGISKTEFAPDKSCTRGQVVTFLYRAYA